MSRRRTAQRGVTLVETVVGMLLMAVIVVAILGGFSATTLAATRHQVDTNLDRLSRSDAEFIKSQAYRPGPGSVYNNIPAPGGYAFATQVLYYDPATNTFSTLFPERGLQQIRVTVSGPGGASEPLYFLRVRP